MSRPIEIPRLVTWLAVAAVVANAAATIPTFFVPDILTGPAVTNGNARGTALVMLAVAIPVLVISGWFVRRGSWRALVIAIGALAYLAYNDVLLLFLTPFNPLFLIYVAAFSTTFWALAAGLPAIDPAVVADQRPRLPARGLALYAWVIVVLNTLIWLRTIVPAMLADDPTSFLDGTGVATNAIFVQDLAFWLPAAAVIGWLAWNRRPIGVLLIGAWLVYGLLESIGVAVDQWFGTAADPGSPHASIAAVQLFAVLAVIGLVPLWFFLRRESPAVTSISRRTSPTPG